MEDDLNNKDGENIVIRLAELERENRRLRREIVHLKNAVVQEKLASTTVLNQQKASTFINRERERYLALLLANSPSIILILNHSGRIEFCSHYFIIKAGYAYSKDILGHTLTEVLSRFLDSESHDKLLEYCGNVIRTNTSMTFDVTFSFDDSGLAEDFSGLLVPMNDEQQHSSGIMVMFHDITDLKRSREAALAASKAKSSFLSNMSHEIRTPMNAIIGMTSIGKNERVIERKNYAFEQIENASRHLLGVINDILDISKIESGKMELSNIVFNFAQMLDRVISVNALKMQDKRQHFTVEVDENIPKTLFGDDQRLAQVITNILSNAIKFTPEDGYITFNAKVLSINNNTCELLMYVKDSGIGMSKQVQSKLFSIFQQAEAGTARKYGGSGLGLAISRRILEMMDGEIWVESVEGKGSCFFMKVSLLIPNSKEAAEHKDQEAALDEEDGSVADFTGKVILVADDIDINLEIIAALLEPTNITVDTANNGRETVEAFTARPERYDLILMDVQMPEMDGLEATRIIRALNAPNARSIPIIAMTANVFKEDIEKCIEAGMNGHLGKPIDMNDVMKIMSRYMKKK